MSWSLARPSWHMGTAADRQPDNAATGDLSPVADAVLLGAAAAGDEASFGQLVERHYGLVFRVASRVLANAADAEDVVQETFVRLWRDPGVINNPAALKGWLAQVARNMAIDRLRRLKPSTGDGFDDLADQATAPDGALRHSQAANLVSEALAALPERQRMALQLTYFEGLGNQETAQAMQVTVEAVESLLSRGRRSLRDTLSSVWGDLIEELEQLK